MNLEQFYQLSDDELVGTKGGFGLAEAVGIASLSWHMHQCRSLRSVSWLLPL